MLSILLTIIAFIVIKFIVEFIIDSVAQNKSIKSAGGLKTKYSVLINKIMESDPRIKIYEESNLFVIVGISGIAGSQLLHLSASYGNIAIMMEVKNNPVFGHYKMEWRFPEDMDQHLMYEQMIHDIAQKNDYLINRYQ